MRCSKRVDALDVHLSARTEGNFIVEYWCHGEHVSQEVEPFELTDGLASYTAFNADTSALLPDVGAIKAAENDGSQ